MLQNLLTLTSINFAPPGKSRGISLRHENWHPVLAYSGKVSPMFLYFYQSKETSFMKTMTCKQLGGACDQALSANTFDEIAMLASKHGREMIAKGDQAHIDAMNEMRQQMASPQAVQQWMADKRKAFESTPDDK